MQFSALQQATEANQADEMLTVVIIFIRISLWVAMLSTLHTLSWKVSGN
jgi:hypothetical protein